MTTFNEDQLDALREIVNVAMGRAGDALARLLDRFIELPVPAIRFVDAPRVLDAIREMVSDHVSITAVRQAFSTVAPGECVVIFGATSFHELAVLTGLDPADGLAAEEELILHVANLLVGACVGGIADQLAQEMTYSPPSIIVRDGDVDRVLDATALPWKTALVVEVNFRVEGRAFVAHSLVFWPETAIERVREHIDSFLAAL